MITLSNANRIMIYLSKYTSRYFGGLGSLFWRLTLPQFGFYKNVYRLVEIRPDHAENFLCDVSRMNITTADWQIPKLIDSVLVKKSLTVVRIVTFYYACSFHRASIHIIMYFKCCCFFSRQQFSLFSFCTDLHISWNTLYLVRTC